MTLLDRVGTHRGYWDSPWPVECGGNRRQKTTSGRLDAREATPEVVTRLSDRWEVMTIRRDPGEWYVGGTMPAFVAGSVSPYGWVQRIDPDTLEPIAESPPLSSGDHVWCGAILAHANGSIYSVNGSYVHRLNPVDLSVQAERLLVDRSHNGLLVLSDGTLITKDLRLENQGRSTLTRLDPETLATIGASLVLPEGSMGRIAADIATDAAVGTGMETDNPTGDLIYVPGTEHLFRVVVSGDELKIDPNWQPRYRSQGGEQGMAWDVCLSQDWCWVMDNGDVASVRQIHTVHPNGRFTTRPDLSWRRAAPWKGAQRLIRVRLDNAEAIEEIAPFGAPGGGVIAPPVNIPEHHRVVAWDSINGALAGIDTSGDVLKPAWQLPVRPTMQPVVFVGSGELVINDFTATGEDELVVVDVVTGEITSRVATGSRIANGMFLSAGDDRDVYYCSTLARARIRWS